MLIINISWESTVLKYVFKTLIILTKGKLNVGAENIVHVRYCSVDGYTIRYKSCLWNIIYYH